MSFILDALRKSDARRKQSGAPGLNSPEPPRPPRRRRRRLLPWLAAGLAVFAVVAAGVFVARPGWLPQRLTGADPVEAAGERSASGKAEGKVTGDPPAIASVDEIEGDQLAQQDVPARNDRTEAPSDPTPRAGEPVSGDTESADERTSGQDQGDQRSREEAVRNRRQPIPASPERTVRREAPTRESEPMPSDEATRELEKRLAEQARRRSESPAGPAGSEQSARAADRSVSRPRQEAETASKPTEPKPLNEGVAEYVKAWELPLSVRRDLPELNLTIHVFSPNEAERFVLINGERYVPGDSIGEAQIVDISRDGAIVDFRTHRFLLEPR